MAKRPMTLQQQVQKQQKWKQQQHKLPHLRRPCRLFTFHYRFYASFNALIACNNRRRRYHHSGSSLRFVYCQCYQSSLASCFFMRQLNLNITHTFSHLFHFMMCKLWQLLLLLLLMPLCCCYGFFFFSAALHINHEISVHVQISSLLLCATPPHSGIGQITCLEILVLRSRVEFGPYEK